MSDHQNTEETDLERRAILKTAGAAMIAGWAASVTLTPPAAAQETLPSGATARNSAPLGARLQGVQHFGITVQNMDRAFVFWGSGRNFDFCYDSGVKTEPGTKIKGVAAADISLIGTQRQQSGMCKPLYGRNFHLTVTKIKISPGTPIRKRQRQTQCQRNQERPTQPAPT